MRKSRKFLRGKSPQINMKVTDLQGKFFYKFMRKSHKFLGGKKSTDLREKGPNFTWKKNPQIYMKKSTLREKAQIYEKKSQMYVGKNP